MGLIFSEKDRVKEAKYKYADTFREALSDRLFHVFYKTFCERDLEWIFFQVMLSVVVILYPIYIGFYLKTKNERLTQDVAMYLMTKPGLLKEVSYTVGELWEFADQGILEEKMQELIKSKPRKIKRNIISSWYETLFSR